MELDAIAGPPCRLVPVFFLMRQRACDKGACVRSYTDFDLDKHTVDRVHPNKARTRAHTHSHTHTLTHTCT